MQARAAWSLVTRVAGKVEPSTTVVSISTVPSPPIQISARRRPASRLPGTSIPQSIIVALFSSATAALAPKLEMTARTLGAGRWRTFWTVVSEAKVGLIAATMAAFGRVCSELGIAMMVGGNIKYYTRTMTTAIAMETAGGNFALALALGLILLLIALGINVAAQVFRFPSPRRYPDVL